MEASEKLSEEYTAQIAQLTRDHAEVATEAVALKTERNAAREELGASRTRVEELVRVRRWHKRGVTPRCTLLQSGVACRRPQRYR